MIIKRTKLIKIGNEEMVDLRSYEVAYHRKHKKTARVVVGDEFMDLNPAKLRWFKLIDPQVHQMRYPPFESYQLFSYVWRPSGKLTPLQLSIISK